MSIVKQTPGGTCRCSNTTACGKPYSAAAQTYELRAGVIKALAHPVRLYIVDSLDGGEHCVCELVELIGLDQSTVSKHLAVLKAAGIVSDEKRGRQILYSLRTPCITGFFGCIEETLRSSAQATARALRTGGRRR